MTHTARILQSLDNIVIVGLQSEGEPHWHYLRLDKQKRALLEHACNHPGTALELSDYGEVLLSGWGEKPAEEIHQSFLKSLRMQPSIKG